MEKRVEFSHIFERYKKETVEIQSRILCFSSLSDEIRRNDRSRSVILRNFDEILAKNEFLVGKNVHICDLKLFDVL